MNNIDLQDYIEDYALGTKQIDNQIKPKNKQFHPGIGTFGEDAQVEMVMNHISNNNQKYEDFKLQVPYPSYKRKKLDLLLPDELAIEFKWNSIYYDNGKELGIESVCKTICYPFLKENGNSVSLIGDSIKLFDSGFHEKKAVVFIYYERKKMPVGFNINLLLNQFENTLSKDSKNSFYLGKRCFSEQTELIHPVHQKLKLFGWEILSKNK